MVKMIVGCAAFLAVAWVFLVAVFIAAEGWMTA